MEKDLYQFKVGNLMYWTMHPQLKFLLDDVVEVPYIHYHGYLGSYYVLHVNPDIPGVAFCGLEEAIKGLLSLEN